jgi:hypothetical protein
MVRFPPRPTARSAFGCARGPSEPNLQHPWGRVLSALDEKLDATSVSAGGRAEAKLSLLLKRWKAEGVDGTSIDLKKPPELVLVHGMRRETWKRLGPLDGAGTSYECIEVSSP